jgi:hypothetical protein
MDRLVRSAVRDNAIQDARKLSASLHHLQVENKLLHDENEGLIEALKVKKKHKKKSKVLDLQQREEYHGGAIFWSPRKLREAHTRHSLKEQDERERKFQKLQDRAGREAAAIYKQKVAEEKRVAREAAKRERERVRAERAEQVAERRRQREAQKQAATAAKAIQLSQRGKRAASKKRARDQKRVARAEGAASSEVGGGAAPLPLPKTTRHGRNVNLPSKYK